MQIASINQNIDNVNYVNTSFGKRYLQVITKPGKFDLERVPMVIEDAVRGNKSIQDFINAGEPKTLLQKFISLFKRNEILNVSKSEVVAASFDSVHFSIGKKGSKNAKFGILELDKSKLKQYPNFELRPDKHEITSRILAEQVAKIKDIREYLANDITYGRRFKLFKETLEPEKYNISHKLDSGIYIQL